MTDGNALEIYRQRYNTFRYLDRLHWQMLQIAVGIVAIGAGIAGASEGSSIWWALLIIGSVLILVSFVMSQIRKGIRKNCTVLRRVGAVIGDDGIPVIKRMGSSGWLGLAVGIIGFLFLVISCVNLGLIYL